MMVVWRFGLLQDEVEVNFFKYYVLSFSLPKFRTKAAFIVTKSFFETILHLKKKKGT